MMCVFQLFRIFFLHIKPGIWQINSRKFYLPHQMAQSADVCVSWALFAPVSTGENYTLYFDIVFLKVMRRLILISKNQSSKLGSGHALAAAVMLDLRDFEQEQSICNFFFSNELRKFTISDFPKQTHFGHTFITLFFSSPANRSSL